jgi:hypothetical protein
MPVHCLHGGGGSRRVAYDRAGWPQEGTYRSGAVHQILPTMFPVVRNFGLAQLKMYTVDHEQYCCCSSIFVKRTFHNFLFLPNGLIWNLVWYNCFILVSYSVRFYSCNRIFSAKANLFQFGLAEKIGQELAAPAGWQVMWNCEGRFACGLAVGTVQYTHFTMLAWVECLAGCLLACTPHTYR